MKVMQHTQHLILSIILWVNSLLMYFFSVEMLDSLYIWGFRLLSIMSLVLVIGVNYEKGIKGIKKITSQ